ncbi:hypothetical protein [uncultured Roseovarius sp.]|uniref:hypothetical protein n=1 Tax=Roseovarius sp. TaxID=1486281 RepID=UPI0025F86FA9|nr:hypothetical protein [uncultured Roseovarius sp.]
MLDFLLNCAILYHAHSTPNPAARQSDPLSAHADRQAAAETGTALSRKKNRATCASQHSAARKGKGNG